MTKQQVVIVGAGIAGLACAQVLEKASIEYVILERSSKPGGRVSTEVLDGFTLDAGFQVILDSYPSLHKVVDVAQLKLKPFVSGAIIHTGQSRKHLYHPLRHPLRALQHLFSNPLGLKDLLRFGVVSMRNLLASQGCASDFRTTKEMLRSAGFSDYSIQYFFTPFWGGIFLDPDLDTSAKMFDFTFSHFLRGRACVPEKGMAELPRLMAARLPVDKIRFRTEVIAVQAETTPANTVICSDGSRIECGPVVMATEMDIIEKLTPIQPPPRKWHGTQTVYFSAEKAPSPMPILHLNGAYDGTGMLHCAVMSRVSASYAPEGRSLITATLIAHQDARDEEIQALCRDGLKEFFGHEVDSWVTLRVVKINRALPALEAHAEPYDYDRAEQERNLYVCGDHRLHGSLEGAIASGLATGVRIVRRLQESPVST